MSRLIDADELKKHKFTTQTCNGVEIIDIDVVCVGLIDNAPTVEARPKGKWIHYEQVNGLGGFWKCSCCGEPAIFIPRLDIDNVQMYGWDNSKTNFCPNCGADMRGDI